jgi:hydroxyacylglutathione hydrolase
VFLEKIKSEVVSHLSYLLGSENEAVVVDPKRDIDIYLKISKQKGMNIKYIFETHRNEDYVIGSKELASLTGAEIFHGVWPKFEYGHVVKDGQEFTCGKLTITAIHTPGHTLGCVSYAVIDRASGKEYFLVFTGDTLFVNDVGRTDFAGIERRNWSEKLYDSIFNKLLPLGDHVIICPSHGSGSVCGGRIAERELSSIGVERLLNPLLQISKERFVEIKTNEHHEHAPYFKMMEKYNVEGAPYLGLKKNPPALNSLQFKKVLDEGAIIIDTRPPPSFGAGHIKSSYNLGLKRLGLIGWVLPYEEPVLLVLGDQKHIDYVTSNLMRIGYDNIAGYLNPSMVAWYKSVLPVEKLDLMTVIDLKEKINNSDKWHVLDVRSKDEWMEEHIKGGQNIYVGQLKNKIDEIPQDKEIAVICKSGTRSSYAASILLRNNVKNIHNVLGGIDAWKKAEYPLTTSNN